MTVNPAGQVSIVDNRGLQYVPLAAKLAPGISYNEVVVPTQQHLSENGSKYLGVALVALFGYGLYRYLNHRGETRAMPTKEYKILTLDYEDGTQKEIQLNGELIIKKGDPLLTGAKHFAVRVVDGLENHVKQLDTLRTRRDVVAWLITYQSLTGEGNGKDLVNGTIACGLGNVLRGAMAGENLGLLDGTATIAIIQSLQELRTNGQLPMLNESDSGSSYDFQGIEIKHHKNNMHNYDQFGKTMTNLGQINRSDIAFIASHMQGPLKAILGLTQNAEL